jgi:hypothetical protein
MGGLGAEIDRGAIERRDDRTALLAAQRYDERRRVAEIGAQPNLGHRHIRIPQVRIARMVVAQDLDQRMAEFLADAKLPLAWANSTLTSAVSTSSRHFSNPQNKHIDQQVGAGRAPIR